MFYCTIQLSNGNRKNFYWRIVLFLFESFWIYRIQICYLKIHIQSIIYICNFLGIFFFVLLNILDWKLLRFYSWKERVENFFLDSFLDLLLDWMMSWKDSGSMDSREIYTNYREYSGIRWWKCKRNWKAMDRTCKVREKLKYIIS